MESPVVDVRILGRGEMTLEAQVLLNETVEEFKRRVFGKYLGEDKQCRLIVLGKELQDAHQMGFYKIDQGSCLHAMIGPSRSAARAAIASAGKTVQLDTKSIEWRASAMLWTITVVYWIGALVEIFVCREPFTYAKLGSLLAVTVTALSVVFKASVENVVAIVRSIRWPLLQRTTRT